ncbi:hypothetical protein C1646_776757 [Rhizophagus diaphanus]|nr:hypothetical protein C1646_776757 [Rhizophagus diaphanus] [Rhizophagus sp. MUCL 43196]
MTKCTLASKIADDESDKWAGMENQESSVNTEATTVDEINIGPISNTQSREVSSTPSSDNPSLVRYRNLRYNTLKSLDDKAVRDIDFPEMEACFKCNNDILTFPLREFTRLRCGHIFHRLCTEKKLMLNISNPCSFPNCRKNVETTDIISTTVNYLIGRLPESNITIQDSPLFQSSGTSALTNIMSERFILTFPPMQTPAEPSTMQKKHTRVSSTSTKKSSSKKAKKTGGKKVSFMLKKVVEELLADTPISAIEENLKEANESATSIFLQLSDKIDNAKTKNEGASRGFIFSYFDFGEAVFK